MIARAGRGVALTFALALVAAPAALGSPYIHAHRGGSLVEGTPTYGENTIAAFRNAADEGYILEMDARRTADGEAVLMHDVTLERTTNCTGRVVDYELNDTSARPNLGDCRVDILGTSGNFTQLDPGDPRLEPVPTVQEALELARDAGATVNLEIKNVVVDADYDPTDAYANAVVDAVVASGFPPSRLIVQSFWPPNLTVAEDRAAADDRLRGLDTSLLTSHTVSGAPLQTNEGGPAFADLNGYEWVSPQWPTAGPVTEEAHSLGLQVVPYTVNTDAEIAAAYDAGVDAVISDDPARARRVIAASEPDPPAPPAPPTAAECEATRASRTAPAIQAHDPKPGAPRVFAIQFKQELRHVETYESFRTKMECLLIDHVVPRLASGRPNVVALNEDVGLMTIATGSRGAQARAIFGDPSLSPSCPAAGQPCGAVGALGAVSAAYGPQVAAYAARYPGAIQPVSSGFVAATDTFARGWMQTFSDLAKRYGVYILGSNNQSPFRESRDSTEVALFADPDLPSAPESVFVATEPAVYNEVFMWGPDDVRDEGPLPLRNMVAQNKKVPITPIEQQIQLTSGPSTGPDAIENLRPYAIPGTGARVGFATSLPAFEYDGADSDFSFGRPLASSIDPCSDTATYYMRCLDRLGANLVMQDEANGGGLWPGGSGEGNWQPLEWMRSTWRTAADPTVSFAYNVTPFMVGNLADLTFDGQTSITQRGLETGEGCHYIGNSEFLDGDDPEHLEVYAGPKTEFVAIVPWVTPDAERSELAATGAKLAPGSGDPLENDYLETAIVADLPFPPDPARASCVTATGGGGAGGGGGPGGGAGSGAGPGGTGQPGGKRKRCRKRAAPGQKRRCVTQRLGQASDRG